MVEDIRDIVARNDEFFCNLASLIPEKHFYGQQWEDAVDVKFLKGRERDEAKRKLKALAKGNKRAKLDPDGKYSAQRSGPSTTDGTEEAEMEETSHSKLTLRLPGSPRTQASRDELKLRLQSKVKAYKKQRHADDEKKRVASDAKKWRTSVTNKAKGLTGLAAPKEQPVKSHAERGAKPSNDADDVDLGFGKVELNNGRRNKNAKKPQKKLSKEALLAEAEELARRKQELADDPAGREELQETAWRQALQRAENVKVLDDPKLIRRSLKKEQKEKEKCKLAWLERKQKQERDLRDRQSKRQENLKARSDAKLQKKKERREKKFERRPGFEGRSDTLRTR